MTVITVKGKKRARVSEDAAHPGIRISILRYLGTLRGHVPQYRDSKSGPHTRDRAEGVWWARGGTGLETSNRVFETRITIKIIIRKSDQDLRIMLLIWERIVVCDKNAGRLLLNPYVAGTIRRNPYEM